MSWLLHALSWRTKASGGCGCGFCSIALRTNATMSGFSKKPSEWFSSMSSSTCCSRLICITRAPQTSAILRAYAPLVANVTASVSVRARSGA